MKRPAFQFYPADWRKDVELRSCSVAARGLWIDMLCIAHECEPYGHLAVNGRGMNVAQIAGQIGLTKAQTATLLQELIDMGVARQNEAGVIYSKRMVDDEDLRNRRAEAGAAGAEHGIKGAEHGRKGGRPRTSRAVKEPPLNPPPSSSLSSSPSGLPPSPPSGGRPEGRIEKSPASTGYLDAYKPMTPEEKALSEAARLREMAKFKTTEKAA